MSQKEEDEKLVNIVDERKEEMVSRTGGEPSVRLARFLKPCCMDQHIGTLVPPRPPHLARPKSHDLPECRLDVHFEGWKLPRGEIWKQWVDKLEPIYDPTWKKIGIYDSIFVSTYCFPIDKELVVGLAESWCPDANTFVFSWGEATMTLEDVSIIGGFPILGEPLTKPLTGELLKIEKKLLKGYQDLARSKAHKVSYSPWTKLFMGKNGDLEHAAFLALWLSRFVVPTKPIYTINKQVFPIAIHLSQAIQVALAPVVLASLYRDLRVLKEQIDASCIVEDCEDRDIPATVWAPFQIMQLWAWERFLSLRPNPNCISSGEPRAARWKNLNAKSNIELVRSTIDSPDNFRCRPYSCAMKNWQHPSYYKEQGEWVVVSPNSNEELLSYLRCLVPCELVGLDCIEQYAPHRVGMQFGMDQDIPGPFTRANANSEFAWRTYAKSIRNIRFYIPPCLFESDVTSRYLDWWNQSISARHDETEEVPIHKISSSSHRIPKKSESSGSPPPGFHRKQSGKLQSSLDEDKMTISEWYKRQVQDVTANKEEVSFYKQVPSSSSTTKENVDRKRPMTESKDNTSPIKCTHGDNQLDMITMYSKHAIYSVIAQPLRLNAWDHNLAEGADRARSISSLLKIFPAGDFGMELIKATRRIFLITSGCTRPPTNPWCSEGLKVKQQSLELIGRLLQLR
ncbi:hypothetical protein IFM89_017396 [Coptis chinensis]|uniref:Aminotransferase-like plant mobile domain-containing protein n=1 Tax=Coptis chinensis TaxID=261450 RepID=A0A835LVQ1_9MAGN|nr:hypothetical protein IFM89_017396 [Coptis chinensis]